MLLFDEYLKSVIRKFKIYFAREWLVIFFHTYLQGQWKDGYYFTSEPHSNSNKIYIVLFIYGTILRHFYSIALHGFRDMSLKFHCYMLHYFCSLGTRFNTLS